MAKKYDASSIDIVQGINHVRCRPTMYLVDNRKGGVHQLIKECVDNSVDEHLAGHANAVAIRLSSDGRTFELRDNGRGIPVEVHKETGEPTLTSIVTILGAGGKFRNEAYGGISAGLHGVGLTVVNAVSTSCEVWTRRGKKVYYQQFKKGLAACALRETKDRTVEKGTVIKVSLDPEIFGDARLDPAVIKTHLEQISYLCPKLKLILKTNKDKFIFQNTKGLEAFLKDKLPALDLGPIRIKSKALDIIFGWAWGDSDQETWKSFVNVSPTPDGGAHVKGVQLGISAALQKWSKGKNLTGTDLRNSVVGIIHALVVSPQFVGQSKQKLSGDEVQNEIKAFVKDSAYDWFRKNAKIAKQIVERAKLIKEQRQAYKKARAALKKTTKHTRSALPAKLAISPRCSPEKRELFIVEGQSAGGTVIQARNPRYQEVLPLKGKVLNAARNDIAKLVSNDEVQNIFQSVGAGFGPDFNLERMRVGKVLLLADADSDGEHITCLLLVLFAKYMMPLIQDGHLFVVDSPLFVGENGTERWFGPSKKDILKQAGRKAKQVHISRLKGHGSSTVDDLKFYATGDQRKLYQVTEENVEHAISLMGDDTSIRKELLGLTGEFQ